MAEALQENKRAVIAERNKQAELMVQGHEGLMGPRAICSAHAAWGMKEWAWEKTSVPHLR